MKSTFKKKPWHNFSLLWENSLNPSIQDRNIQDVKYFVNSQKFLIYYFSHIASQNNFFCLSFLFKMKSKEKERNNESNKNVAPFYVTPARVFIDNEMFISRGKGQ